MRKYFDLIAYFFKHQINSDAVLSFLKSVDAFMNKNQYQNQNIPIRYDVYSMQGFFTD